MKNRNLSLLRDPMELYYTEGILVDARLNEFLLIESPVYLYVLFEREIVGKGERGRR